MILKVLYLPKYKTAVIFSQINHPKNGGGGVTLQLHVVYRCFPENWRLWSVRGLSYIWINMAILLQTRNKAENYRSPTPTADEEQNKSETSGFHKSVL